MQALGFGDNKFNYQEPFKSLFTQGMVCHETYKNEKNQWLFPNDIEKDSMGVFCYKKK